MDKSSDAVKIFNKYAKEYQERFMDVSIYHDSFDFFCDRLKLKAKVLELACGPGNITRYLLSKRSDLNITATDLSVNMIEKAKENNPAATCRIIDARAIDTIDQKFDAILCGFGLPYLAKEETEQLIENAAKALNKDGIIYLSTMEDEYEKSGIRKGSKGDEMYMHYYPSEMLIKMLTDAGFILLKEQRKFTRDSNAETVTDLILIAEIKNN